MTDPESPPPPALLIDGPPQARRWVVLAHGAGAPMDSPFMARIAAGLAAAGLGVARFEFPYMARRRQDGGKPPPDRTPVLAASWRAAVAEVRRRFAPEHLVVGGKSMGGRIASLIAAEVAADGLVALGYPFHPAGRPEAMAGRTAHLADLTVPTLIIQGERDPLGNRATVAALRLPPAVRVVWLPDGDHSLKPRQASGHSEAAHLATAVAQLAAFAGAPQ